MSGWQEWFKVKAALDDPEWDFRTIGGIAKETGLDPRQVEQLLAQHRREIRQTLLRDGRVIYTLKTRPKTLRETFAEMQLFARP